LKIFIITGSINSGKSLALQQIYFEKAAEGFSISGIIAKGIFENNRKIGFDLLIPSKNELKTCILARDFEIEPPYFSIGRFFFSNLAFDIAKKSLSILEENSIVFFDEFGWFEMNEKGYFPEFIQILNSNISTLYISVRKDVLSEFIDRFMVNREYSIIDMDEKNHLTNS